MTIADQLTSIANTKATLKSAIEAKGVTVGAAPFSDYPSKVAAISTSGSTAAWTRPSDWLTIPTLTDSDQKFVGLHAVQPEGNYVALSAAGAFTVNWGDGTTESFASGATAQHFYDYNTYDTSNTTLCSRGYKQVIVTVTPQSGQTLTTLNLQKQHTTPAVRYASGFLDIDIAGASLTTLLIAVPSSGNTNPNPYFSLLEQAKIRANAVADFGGIFAQCYVLQSIPILTTTSATSMKGMFSSCASLQTLSTFSTTNVVDMSNMFQNCTTLVSVPLLTTSAVTNMSNMFYGCSLLQYVPQFSTGAVTNMYSMFNSCRTLKSIPLLSTANVTNMSNMFNSCTALSNVPAINTSSVTNMSSMFGNCQTLTSIPLLSTANVTNMSNMFNSCYALSNLPALSTSSVSDMSGMLTYCTSLQSVPALNCSNVTSSSGFSSIFNGCNSLARILMAAFKYTFSVSGCRMSAARLNELFTNLPTVTGQTVTITGNFGAATCDRTIATAKGWTVTG